MNRMSFKNISVQEAIYIDTVCHGLVVCNGMPEEWHRSLLWEAECAGRHNVTNPELREIFRCMDLGMSIRECERWIWSLFRDEGVI